MLEEYHHLVNEYTALLKALEAQGITPKSSAEMVPSPTRSRTHSREGTVSAASVRSDIGTGKLFTQSYFICDGLHMWLLSLQFCAYLGSLITTKFGCSMFNRH